MSIGSLVFVVIRRIGGTVGERRTTRWHRMRQESWFRCCARLLQVDEVMRVDDNQAGFTLKKRQNQSWLWILTREKAARWR